MSTSSVSLLYDMTWKVFLDSLWQIQNSPVNKHRMSDGGFLVVHNWSIIMPLSGDRIYNARRTINTCTFFETTLGKVGHPGDAGHHLSFLWKTILGGSMSIRGNDTKNDRNVLCHCLSQQLWSVIKDAIIVISPEFTDHTVSMSNICLGDLLDDEPEPRHYVPSVWSYLCISVIQILARLDQREKICSEFFNYILQYFSYFMGGLLIKFLTFTDWDLTQSDVTIFIRIASYLLCSLSQYPAEIKRKPEFKRLLNCFPCIALSAIFLSVTASLSRVTRPLTCHVTAARARGSPHVSIIRTQTQGKKQKNII